MKLSCIINQFNNCFLNVCIQMLTSDFELTSCFLKEEYSILFDNYNKCNKTIRINRFILYYSKLNKEYKFGKQADAHEACNIILDDADDKISFQVLIKQIIKQKSKESIEKIITENYLGVSMDDDLQKSLNNEFNFNELNEFNYFPISEPNFLFILIKRFDNYGKKNNNEMLIQNNIKYGNSKYNLICTINHIGNTNNGHYFNLKIINDVWYLINDDKSYIVTHKEFNHYKNLSYILLYKKEI